MRGDDLKNGMDWYPSPSSPPPPPPLKHTHRHTDLKNEKNWPEKWERLIWKSGMDWPEKIEKFVFKNEKE